eukprot:366239-Chlamydomonas_euryale.AAC.44
MHAQLDVCMLHACTHGSRMHAQLHACMHSSMHACKHSSMYACTARRLPTPALPTCPTICTPMSAQLHACSMAQEHKAHLQDLATRSLVLGANRAGDVPPLPHRCCTRLHAIARPASRNRRLQKAVRVFRGDRGCSRRGPPALPSVATAQGSSGRNCVGAVRGNTFFLGGGGVKASGQAWQGGTRVGGDQGCRGLTLGSEIILTRVN